MAYASTNMTQIKAGIARKGLMAAMVDGFRTYRTYVQTVAELNALSGAELADIGLNRSMIRRTALDVAMGKSGK